LQKSDATFNWGTRGNNSMLKSKISSLAKVALISGVVSTLALQTYFPISLSLAASAEASETKFHAELITHAQQDKGAAPVETNQSIEKNLTDKPFEGNLPEIILIGTVLSERGANSALINIAGFGGLTVRIKDSVFGAYIVDDISEKRLLLKNRISGDVVTVLMRNNYTNSATEDADMQNETDITDLPLMTRYYNQKITADDDPRIEERAALEAMYKTKIPILKYYNQAVSVDANRQSESSGIAESAPMVKYYNQAIPTEESVRQ